mgnify:CR=1 FL=1
MWVGMLVIAGSFVVAAFLQLKIDDSQEGTVSVFWQVSPRLSVSHGDKKKNLSELCDSCDYLLEINWRKTCCVCTLASCPDPTICTVICR